MEENVEGDVGEKGETQDELGLQEDADGWCIVSVSKSKSYFPQISYIFVMFMSLSNVL